MAAPVIASVGDLFPGSAPGATVTLDAPPGITEDDLLVCLLYVEHNGSGSLLSPPEGWEPPPGAPAFQAVSSGCAVYVWYRIADADDEDAASFAFPTQTGRWTRGAVARVTGHDPANPWDDGDGAVAANSSSTPSVSAATTGDERLVIWTAGSYNTNSWPNMPAGFTEHPTWASSGNTTSTVATRTLDTAGSAGGSVSVGTGNGKAAWIGAVRPAPAAPAHDTVRLYTTSVPAGTVPADGPMSFWNATPPSATAAPLLLGNTPAGDPDERSQSETSTTDGYLTLVQQWVSGPAESDGQLLELDWTAMIAAFASSADADMHLALGAWIMATDGTHRTDLVGVAGLDVPANEWPAGTDRDDALVRGITTNFPDGAILPQDISTGECIVLELGHRAWNTSGTEQTGTLLIGGTATPDLQATDVAPNLDRPSWLEIAVSPGLTFADPPLIPPGSVFDLSAWKWQGPIEDPDDPGDLIEVEQPELDSYSSPYLYLDEQGRMVMVAPVNGFTTGDSARSELREMENGVEAAWSIYDTEPRQLTVTGYFDPTNVSGGTNPRPEEIIGQIHGTLGSPPLMLAAEYHVATPRIRVFKYNGETSPGFGNMLSGITTATLATYRIEYVPGVDPANGTGRIIVSGAFGGPENLPTSGTIDRFVFAPADFFGQTDQWYFKAGAYPKTNAASGATGEGVATITALQLIQPSGGGSTTGTLAATIPAPAAALQATVAGTGALTADLPLPAADLTGSTRTSGDLTSAVPLPTADLAGTVRAAGTIAAQLPSPTAGLIAATTTTGALDATLPLPATDISGAATAAGQLAAVLPLPGVHLDGTIAAAAALEATLPTPVAAFDGITATSGHLVGTLPIPAADFTGQATAAGELAAVLPLPLADLGGDGEVRGHLSGTAPLPAAALGGTVTAAAVLAGTLPAPEIALDGTVTASGGNLAATLPIPAAALAGSAAADGTLAAVLPLPRAAIGAGGTATGRLDATLPVARAGLAGQVRNPGPLAAVLPMPEAALDSISGTAGQLAAVLPLPAADLYGTTSTGGRLDAALPVPQAALGGAVIGTGVLDAALPLPRTAIVADVDDPESSLEAVIPLPTAALTGHLTAPAVLTAVLPLPTADLVTTPPPTYEGPLRAGRPEWGRPRLRAGIPELAS